MLKILGFVGVGQFAFVGGVNRQLNKYYRVYCDLALGANPPMVVKAGSDVLPPPPRCSDRQLPWILS